MKLKLGSKTYYTKELTFGHLYKANEFRKYISDGGTQGENPLSELDKCAEYLVELFNDQFTVDDVYKKLPLQGCLLLILDLANKVQEEASKQLEIKNVPAVN